MLSKTFLFLTACLVVGCQEERLQQSIRRSKSLRRAHALDNDQEEDAPDAETWHRRLQRHGEIVHPPNATMSLRHGRSNNTRIAATGSPSSAPSAVPSAPPTRKPSKSRKRPSSVPTPSPRAVPSEAPTTGAPSRRPSSVSSPPPSTVPSGIPTTVPSKAPTTGTPSSAPQSVPPSSPPSVTRSPLEIPNDGAPSKFLLIYFVLFLLVIVFVQIVFTVECRRRSQW